MITSRLLIKKFLGRHQTKGAAFGFSYLKDLAEYLGKIMLSMILTVIILEVVRFGLLSFSFKKFINKGGVNFAYRVNSSVGLNQAPALFASKTERSEKNISLWVVPVDFALDMEMLLGEKFKLELHGGPLFAVFFKIDMTKVKERIKRG